MIKTFSNDRNIVRRNNEAVNYLNKQTNKQRNEHTNEHHPTQRVMIKDSMA